MNSHPLARWPFATGSSPACALLALFAFLALVIPPSPAKAAGEIAALHAEANGDIFGLAALTDGRLLVSGNFTTIRGLNASRIARLTNEANPDGTFVASANESVRTLAVQSDGRIVIAGAFTQVNGTTRNRIARLNGDGTLDTGFDPNTNDFTQAALQPDGKVLLTGFFTTVKPNGAPTATTRNYLARVNADGTLDTSFNPNPDNYVYHVSVLPDGKLLVAGAFTTLQPNGAASPTTMRGVARLNADGTLDPAFADPNVNATVHNAVPLPDGRYIVSGFFTSVNGTARGRIARLNANGSLDLSYHPNANERIDSLSLQADGRLIAGGDFTTLAGAPRVRLARLNDAGVVDATFEANPNAFALGTMLQPDGYMILGGQFTQVQTPSNGTVARSRFARLFNEGGGNFVEVPANDRVRWIDFGTAATTESVAFELSTDGGNSFTPLGPGTRTATGWELTGLALPPNGLVRGLARFRSGHLNGCSGLLLGGAIFSDLPQPAASVLGNGLLIVPGDTTPSEADGTDLGHATRNGGVVARTFTIQNSGPGTLYLGPVSVASGGGFAIASQPAASTLAPGASTTFQVTFAPMFGGAQLGTVSIPNNQFGQTTYTFQVRGTCTDVDGIFNPNPSEGAGQVLCIAVMPDTRLVLGGTFQFLGGLFRPGLYRLHANGVGDASYFGDSKMQAYGIQLYHEGSIVAAGANLQTPVQSRRLMRFTPDGTVDSGFNATLDGGGQGVVLQPDNGIIVHGGFFLLSGANRNGLGRVLVNGVADTGFITPISFATDCVARQRDGRILVGGSFTTLNSIAAPGLARLEIDGSLDPTFRGFTNSGGRVYAVFILPDGRILVGGNFTHLGGQPRAHFGRLLPDGSLDATFAPVVDGEVRHLLPQADGRVLVAGNFNNIGGAPRFAFGRVMPDGSVDASFVPKSNGGITSMALEADGSMILAGHFQVMNGTNRGGLCRFTNYPATQTLQITPSRLTWLRGGSAPECTRVDFEYSSNGGASYTLLGEGRPIAGGWEITGLNLPPNGRVRALGRVGQRGEGLVEMAQNIILATPSLTVAGTAQIFNGAAAPKFSDGSDLGPAALPGGVATRTFTIAAPGGVPVNVGNVTLSGPDAADFSVTLQPTSPIPAGQSTTFTVRFAPSAAGPRRATVSFTHDQPSTVENPFNFAVGGFGGNLDLTFAPTLTPGSEVFSVSPGLHLGGTFSVINGQPRLCLGRLNVNGTLAADFNLGAVGAVYTFGVQPDGKVLVGGGFNQLAGVSRTNFGRLLPDGSDDPSFTPGAINGLVLAALPLRDGRTLIAGSFNNVAGQGRYLARLGPDGTLDGYGPLGATTFNLIYSLAMQRDRSVLVAGQFVNSGLRRNLVRVLDDGPVDTTFVPNPDGPVFCAVEQADGKILLGGQFNNVGGVPRLNLARVNADGSLDTGFVANASRIVRSLVLQADGKILVSGNFRSIGAAIPYTPRERIARLLPDGTLDPSFDPGADANTYATLTENGDALFAGSFTQLGGAPRASLARVLAEGGSESVASPSQNRLQWLRSGSLPELANVTFEISSDEVNWIFLGYGSRIAGGWEWQSAIPRFGYVRVRGLVAGAGDNASYGYITRQGPYENRSALEAWRQLHFGSTENIGNGADDFDFDRDGLSNLLEFAFGQNPTLANSAVLPPLQRNATNAFFSFAQPPGVAGITYAAEWSNDLTGVWTPIADTGAGAGQHLFTLPVGANSHLFLRLRVSVP